MPQLGYSPLSITHLVRGMFKITLGEVLVRYILPEPTLYFSCSSFPKLRVYCMVI